jgi:tetratricopeptide (TPR) repeat protein
MSYYGNSARLESQTVLFSHGYNRNEIGIDNMNKLGAMIAFWRADRCRDRGDFAGAASLYRQGVSLSPMAFGYWVQYGHMLKELGDLAAAEDAYMKAHDLRSDDADLHVQLGHLYSRKGDMGKASSLYAKAASLGSDDPHARRFSSNPRRQTNEPQRHQSAEELFQIGDELRDSGQAAVAAKFYSAGLVKSPTAFAYWVQLGNMLKDTDNFEEAESAYINALNLRSNDSDLYLQLGHLKTRAGAPTPAAEFYAKAVMLGSRDVFAMNTLANRNERFEVIRSALIKLLPTKKEKVLSKTGTYESFAKLILDATH